MDLDPRTMDTITLLETIKSLRRQLRHEQLHSSLLSVLVSCGEHLLATSRRECLRELSDNNPHPAMDILSSDVSTAKAIVREINNQVDTTDLLFEMEECRNVIRTCRELFLFQRKNNR